MRPAHSLARSDFLILTENAEGRRIQKICDDGTGKVALCQVDPCFSQSHSMDITGNFSLDVECREITTRREFDAAARLNCYHYRRLNLWGVSHTLILQLKGHWEPLTDDGVIGYITLNSAPLLTRPRDELIGWDKKGRLENIDRIVRIARVVVHPEFRGLGVGRALVRAGVAYAASHWNVMGKKPWLIEAVAEMSKFHPLFESAGMVRYGSTVGRSQVLITPADQLDHVMGAGHWRASLDRMRMTASSPKPYYALCLNGFSPAGHRNRHPDHDQCDAKVGRDPKGRGSSAPPPVIRFDSVTLAYGQGANPLLPGTSAAERTGSHTPMARLALHDSFCLAERMVEEIAAYHTGGTMHSWRKACKDAHAEDTVHQWTEVGKMVKHLETKLVACVSTLRQVADEADTITAEVASASHRADVARQRAVAAVDNLADALDASIEQVLGAPPRSTRTWGTLSQARTWVADLRRSIVSPGASSREKEIAQAFGIDLRTREHVVLHGFNLDVLPGQVVLLIGASGSGKTSLLNILSGASSVTVTAGRVLPGNVQSVVGTLDLDFPPDVPVIDLVGGSTREACQVLNVAGISEAKVYVRRRDELSHGQRYRVAAAILAASGKAVWIADEFCAFLDPLTATVVSRGLARLARQMGVTLIVAVADGSRVADGLRPDVTVRLSYGGRPIPDPQLQYWKHSHDWRSRLDATAVAAARSDKSAVSAALRAHDLVYYRLTTEHALSQRGVGGERDESAIEGRVADSLSLVTCGKWTPTTTRRQVLMRARLWRDLHGQ
jgi:ABC-type lipoprotein export system ATPase subunit/GNAT superfamily N-acetyltransferase